ncbi:C40 family peptidase [Paenibacillus sp. FA6]|uniref:C40 family peptidase n=1 Tax=Paenibacillus sp. FA6 TaxID=3413029 RepID=UPI003F6600AF
MKIRTKVISASFAAVMLFGGLSTTVLVQQVEAATSTSKVTWGVNLRKAPTTSSSVIRMLKKGEKIVVLEKSGASWLKVKNVEGTIGYISSSSKYTTKDSGNSGNNNTTSSSVEKVIAAGMKYMGTPYEYGSSRSNTATFDCSDFIRQIYMDGLGIKLPADSRAQGSYVKDKGTVQTDWTKLKRGDLMFFMSYKGSSASAYSGVKKSTARITHDGIYLGNGQILHTYSKESGGVTISKIDGTHWEKRFLFGGSAL